MDGSRFDDLARALAGGRSRRGFARGAVAAALGVAGVAARGTSGLAVRCQKDGDCAGCQTCNKRKGRCAAGCGKDKRCCGDACVAPEECCSGPEQCNACSACVGGRCRPDLAKNDQPCGPAEKCLVCANGTCGIPSDARCRSNERCRPRTGACCTKCTKDGNCCPEGSACIDPGMLSANSCCDRSLNTPCGDNDDGTFAECCSNRNEVCEGGACKPKDECAGGRRTAQGICCADPDKLCENRSRCCAAEEICGVDDVCENPNVCPRPACSLRGKKCCPPNGFFANAYCCESHQDCVSGSVGCAEPPQ